MTHSYLILVSGPPASGKTTLSKLISKDLKIPVYSKDQLKERLFDTIGFKDRELSKQFGRICSETLWYIAEAEVQLGRSLILESNFDPEFTHSQFNKLRNLSPLKVIEVFCTAPKNILINRLVDRAKRRERHPGHCDPISSEQVEQQYFLRDIKPLELSPDWIEFDTSDLSNLKIDETLKALKERLL